MLKDSMEMCAHTTQDGLLSLTINVGLRDTDVAVEIRVKRVGPRGEVDVNGWPKGFFDRVPGSMPGLTRPPQGDFEERLPLA